MKIILGASKDKGGSISIRDHIVEVTRIVSGNYIKALFGLSDCGEGTSIGQRTDNAFSIVNKAIIAISTCPEIVGNSSIFSEDYDLRSQELLEDLVSIRGSILKAKRSNYQEYGIEIVD